MLGGGRAGREVRLLKILMLQGIFNCFISSGCLL